MKKLYYFFRRTSVTYWYSGFFSAGALDALAKKEWLHAFCVATLAVATLWLAAKKQKGGRVCLTSD
jgi:hypothetical protein